MSSSNGGHSTPRIAAAMRLESLHQKVDAITAGQRHLEVQFQQQQQQLERLTRLVEASLATSSASTSRLHSGKPLD
ncbi:hypothetical protein PRIC2_010358 [Phytophthora ramorum]